MNRRTVKIIVYIIVIAMLATTLFSFVFFLPQRGAVYGAEKERAHVNLSLEQGIHAMIPPEQQRFLSEQLRELERFIKFIQENFKDDVDFSTLTQGAFEGILNALNDPDSEFFEDADAGEAFIENIIGEFGGIGVTLTRNPEGLSEISAIVPGGPADRAGIRRGDVIVSIDGIDVAQKSLDEISRMLRGEVGRSVVVVTRRAGEARSFTITRETIRMSRVNFELLENNIGYIQIIVFDANSAREFRAAVANLKRAGAQSLILDLRNNLGGLVNAAIEVADEFISSGDIVHLAKRNEIVESAVATEGASVLLDTVVLVNGYTASAAEILAAALMENEVATVVGTVTYGKGTVQTIAYANDQPYRLSLYYFLTPNEDHINNVGITPNYIVRNSLGEYRAEARALFNMFAPFIENTRPWPGETGLNVFAAQQRLILLGFALDLTATMDEATVAAIRAFQHEQGLYVYGVLDFTTMRRIQEVTVAHVNNDSLEDLQLKRAIEILSN